MYDTNLKWRRMGAKALIFAWCNTTNMDYGVCGSSASRFHYDQVQGRKKENLKRLYSKKKHGGMN